MLDFNVIPIFLAVVEEGSFSRAAEKLGITTSAVSRRISSLEERLGTRLLLRTTRTLSLTESGQRYLEYSRQALLAINDAENAARERKDVASGTLRLSAPVNLGRGQLAHLIPVFLKANPLVNFHITLGDVFTRVNPEDFDLIITAAPIPSGSYKSTKIHSIPGAIIASPDYLKKYGRPGKPEDLLNHNCLLPSFQEIYDNWIFYKDDQEVKVKVNGNYFCNNPVAVKITALAGHGIACLPIEVVKDELASGELVKLFEDYHLPTRSLRAYHIEKHFVPAKVKVFVDFLVENLGVD